ncbi:Ycf66 family protein [Spirulina subsalsa]|uniref:Ycf66 family protein n=1 Tax=Spirulina subsalsa TaxID=54311 RepID=UPI00030B61BD|nr:Ycf66 family protein [Spirulina subsalsa]
MLANILAAIVGLGSFIFYMAAFFFPEVHRKNDFIWSGVGLFYALVLWLCAGRITGGVLLGQTASVALLVWLGGQTLILRRQKTPSAQQTEVSPELKEKVEGFSIQGLLSPLTNFFKKSPKAGSTDEPAASETTEMVATLEDSAPTTEGETETEGKAALEPDSPEPISEGAEPSRTDTPTPEPDNDAEMATDAPEPISEGAEPSRTDTPAPEPDNDAETATDAPEPISEGAEPSRTDTPAPEPILAEMTLDEEKRGEVGEDGIETSAGEAEGEAVENLQPEEKPTATTWDGVLEETETPDSSELEYQETDEGKKTGTPDDLSS